MNAALPTPAAAAAPMMSSADYRESLRRLEPVVYVDGQLIESVADAPCLAPGVNALGYTYDIARDAKLVPLMTATQNSDGRVVNRMLHVNESAGDLLNKLEAVRIMCRETGCAQRYLAHDALNALAQVSARIDAPGITIVARPAARPGEKLEHGAALFSRRYGQSTGAAQHTAKSASSRLML